MKKIILFLFMLIIMPVQSAQIANIEYIHTAIADKWDITIPYNREITNVGVAANMKYLLTAVDVANEILNGKKTTDYGNGEFATMVAADTVATDTAVDGLIVKDSTDYKLYLTHDYRQDIREPNHLIMISAAGTYIINWGDGTKEVIEKDSVGEQWFGHDYASDGEYTVSIGGQATKYSEDPNVSTVKLGADVYSDWPPASLLGLTDIDGCLGCIFPTLDDGSQPRFIYTFPNTYELNNDIPSGFFSGVHGAPVENMFKGTFESSGIKSIPSDLFAGIQGPPVAGMFDHTFAHSGIESIPENLFAGIQGPPVAGMFDYTFTGTPNLTSIPSDLFAGIQGPPVAGMFTSTFSDSGIESIPSDLFAGIQGPPVADMFEETFAATLNLTSIPSDLFAGIQGPPAENMFTRTFYYTAITSIPSDLFAGIHGAPVENMFNGTFSWSGITSIPSDLFAGIDVNAPYPQFIFPNTFSNCHYLTGPSAKINGRYLYEIWPDAKGSTYYSCEGLDDWDSIPDSWK